MGMGRASFSGIDNNVNSICPDIFQIACGKRNGETKANGRTDRGWGEGAQTCVAVVREITKAIATVGERRPRDLATKSTASRLDKTGSSGLRVFGRRCLVVN